MVTCPKCGNDNRQGSRFCRICGDPLEEPASPASAAPTVRRDQLPPADDSHSRPTVRIGRKPAPPTVRRAAPGSTTPVQPRQAPPAETPTAAAAPSPSQSTTGAESSSGGLILQNRYRLGAALSQDAASTLYSAEDMLLCWSCAAVQTRPDERFCESCGAEMSQHPKVGLREFSDAGGSVGGSVGEFVENGRRYRLEDAPQSGVPARPRLPRFSVGCLSDVGKVREINEDSLLTLIFQAVSESQNRPLMGFFAVADGIGGHSAGEVASRAAIRSLAEGLMKRVFIPAAGGETLLPDSLTDHIWDAVWVTNQAVLNLRQKQDTDMGCTLTAALVLGQHAIVTNVGDSRTYLMRGGKLAQVTKDHSLVARLIANGIAKPEEAYAHTEKGVIYRSLGDKLEIEIDTFPLELQPGDRLLLCCDGLWEMVRDPIIEDTLLEQSDPQAACNKLVELANLGGGYDNISVIVVDVD